ncbi:MAG: hypothetical protein IAG10_12490, partial [Planctomycetaceae bacterium]|nr:hypothetical protein [Planctomycetaceae bacterium]
MAVTRSRRFAFGLTVVCCLFATQPAFADRNSSIATIFERLYPSNSAAPKPILAGLATVMNSNDKEVRLVATPVTAVLIREEAEKTMRLVIDGVERSVIDADFPIANRAILQSAEIDPDNATPEILVAFEAANGSAKVYVATARSDGPGWDMTPEPITASALFDGPAMTSVHHPSTFIIAAETLTIEDLEPTENFLLRSGFTLRSGAWTRVTGEVSVAIAREQARRVATIIGERSSPWSTEEERELVTLAMALAGRLGVAMTDSTVSKWRTFYPPAK